MAQEHFAQLGLSPGRYSARELDARFQQRRRALLRELEAGPSVATQTRLDDLYIAYNALRQGRRAGRAADPQTPVEQVRQMILVALEDGLLRHSRREAILERAAALGFNEFQTHLLIAQVQFGDDQIAPLPRQRPVHRTPHDGRAWARLAVVGVMALATFWGLAAWAGV